MAALTQAEIDTQQAGNPVATQAQARMALVKARLFTGARWHIAREVEADLRIGVSTTRKQHPLAGLSQ